MSSLISQPKYICFVEALLYVLRSHNLLLLEVLQVKDGFSMCSPLTIKIRRIINVLRAHQGSQGVLAMADEISNEGGVVAVTKMALIFYKVLQLIIVFVTHGSVLGI